MRFRQLPLIALLVVSCSTGARNESAPSPQPSATGRAKEIVATLTKYDAFAAHLGAGARLELAGGGFRAASLAGSTTSSGGTPLAGNWTASGPRLEATLPTHLGAPMHLGLAGSSGFWIEVTEKDVADTQGEVVEGAVVFAGGTDALDVVHVAEATRVESLRLARTLESATHTRYQLKLGAEVASIRLRDGAIEVLDRDGRVRIAAERPFAVDARGVRRFLSVAITGEVMDLALDTTDLVVPIAIDPAWAATASVAIARVFPVVVPLKTGKVLIAGGEGSTGVSPTNSAEVYDPTTSTWTSLPNMSSKRQECSGVLLADGRVLVAGGEDGVTGDSATADIFDPTTNTWSAAAAMPVARRNYAAVRLADNKVLLAGGNGQVSLVVYDPGANTWTTKTAKLTTARFNAKATLLPDGRVLFIGGVDEGTPRRSSDTAEIWSPTTDTMTAATRMPSRRSRHEVFLVPSGTKAGKVIVIGGVGGEVPEETLPSVMIYDPPTNSWSGGKALSTGRLAFASAYLPSGKILVAGGSTSATVLPLPLVPTAELYDVEADTWTPAGSLSVARATIGALLPSGGALAISGATAFDSTFVTLSNVVDRFTPSADGSTCTLAGECASGFCVDAHCCKVAACAPYSCTTGVCGTTCTSSSDCASTHFCDAAKTCQPRKDGAGTCAKGEECKNGKCVDGVCCDTDCTEQCGACDVAGHIGTCSPAKGAPHGARAACAKDATNACASKTCDGLDKATCATTVGAETSCRVASCAAGIATSPASCSAGACPAAVTTPCGAYKCDATACKTKCATTDDCSEGYSCQSTTCLPKTSSCTSDGLEMVSADGTHTPCTPYLCQSSICGNSCRTSSDCVPGSSCDDTGKCTPPVAASTEDGGGCAVATPSRERGSSNDWLVVVGALVGLSLAGRRRKAR